MKKVFECDVREEKAKQILYAGGVPVTRLAKIKFTLSLEVFFIKYTIFDWFNETKECFIMFDFKGHCARYYPYNCVYFHGELLLCVSYL